MQTASVGSGRRIVRKSESTKPQKKQMIQKNLNVLSKLYSPSRITRLTPLKNTNPIPHASAGDSAQEAMMIPTFSQ